MIWYALVTIFLSLIDSLRIRWKNARTRVPVGNNDINHAVSTGLAVVAATVLWLVIHGFAIAWAAVTFAVGCAAVRVILFDPFENLFRRLPIATTSGKSSSKTEQGWGKVPFWWRRIIGAAVLGIVILINHFL